MCQFDKANQNCAGDSGKTEGDEKKRYGDRRSICLKFLFTNMSTGPDSESSHQNFTGNPHMVLEGLIIGAYAIGAHRGFIYTRHDSPQLKKNIDCALKQAEEYGLFSENILGSGFNFQVEVHIRKLASMQHQIIE